MMEPSVAIKPTNNQHKSSKPNQLNQKESNELKHTALKLNFLLLVESIVRKVNIRGFIQVIYCVFNNTGLSKQMLSQFGELKLGFTS